MNLRLNVFSSCNLSCKHCYYKNKVGFDNQEMSLVQAKKIIDEAFFIFGDKLRVVVMGGGEPLLYKHLFELLKYISIKRKIPVSITSNMILISDEDLVKFKDLRVHIHASIEGTEEYNDYVRGKGTFRGVFKVIRNAKKIGVKVSINMTLNKFNIFHISYIIKLFKPFVEYFTFSRYIPYYKDDKIKELSSSDYKGVQKIISKYEKYNFKSRQERFLRLEKDVIGKKKDFSIYDLRSLYILPNMRVYPAWNLIDYPLGDMKEENLKDILENGKLEKLYNPDNLTGLCSQCKYKNKCGGDRGVAYFYTGDFWGDDNQCPFIINNTLNYDE